MTALEDLCRLVELPASPQVDGAILALVRSIGPDLVDLGGAHRRQQAAALAAAQARVLEMTPLLDEYGEVLPLDAVETEVIRFAIAHYRGQMSKVAKRLRIGRSTIYRRLDVPAIAYARAAVKEEAQ